MTRFVTIVLASAVLSSTRLAAQNAMRVLWHSPSDTATVSIDPGLKAVDGSPVADSSAFGFRTFGPKLIERSFHPYNADTLAPDGRVQLLYSAPVDIARLERGARMELAGCAGPKVIPLYAQQHALRADDSPRFQNPGLAARDSFSARFRTVVELEPAVTPPMECSAKLVIPTMDDEASIGKEERYSLSTVAV